VKNIEVKIGQVYETRTNAGLARYRIEDINRAGVARMNLTMPPMSHRITIYGRVEVIVKDRLLRSVAVEMRH
jgi:hypothetical protein